MMNGQTRQNILVDTSIPLEGGEDIIAKLDKVAPVFVTDIVLQELDGHKNNANGTVAYQAREFFRRLGKTNGEALFVLPPDGMKLEKTDTLRKMTLGNTTLHVIVRKPYKSRDINDSKIIEVAKDYNMTLVTLDMAQRVRAMSEGVNVETLMIQKNIRPSVRKIAQKALSMVLFILFVAFFVNIAFGLSQPLKEMDVAHTAKIGFMLFGCMFLIGFVKYLLAEKNGVENISNRRKTKDKDDWQTDPTNNLLIGNIFHDSIND